MLGLGPLPYSESVCLQLMSVAVSAKALNSPPPSRQTFSSYLRRLPWRPGCPHSPAPLLDMLQYRLAG